MSHFVRCDRCATENTVMGTLSLPPGWQKMCAADLCESCCELVRDFIRFKPSDAERLPVEPIPQEFAGGPASDKLFETAPEEKPNADHAVPVSADHANPSPVAAATDGGSSEDARRSDDGLRRASDGAQHLVSGADHAPAPADPLAESSAEERIRTKAAKRRKKLLAEVQPDKRTRFPHGANEGPQP